MILTKYDEGRTIRLGVIFLGGLLATQRHRQTHPQQGNRVRDLSSSRTKWMHSAIVKVFSAFVMYSLQYPYACRHFSGTSL